MIFIEPALIGSDFQWNFGAATANVAGGQVVPFNSNRVLLVFFNGTGANCWVRPDSFVQSQTGYLVTSGQDREFWFDRHGPAVGLAWYIADGLFPQAINWAELTLRPKRRRK